MEAVQEAQEADFSVPTVSTEQEKMLARFELPLAVIEGLKTKYMGLIIPHAKDKHAYDAVQAARMEVRAHRIAVEKKHKELKDAALKYGRVCDWGKNYLIAAIDPLEEHLNAEKARIDAEIQAEKDRRQQEINDRYKRRLDALISVNAGTAIRYEDLPGMDEADFQAHLKVATDKFNKEARIKAEQEAEIARLRKAEEEQKAREAAALEQQRKEMAEAQAKLDKQRQEQEAREAALKAEADLLEREKREAEEKVRKEAEAKAHAEEIAKAREEAAAKAKAEAESQAKAKAAQDEKDRLEAEAKAKAEADRKAALATDMEKIQIYIAAIRSIQVPVINNPELKYGFSVFGMAIQEFESKYKL